VAQVAVCSEKDTKQINTVWAERTVAEILTFWSLNYFFLILTHSVYKM
jgi:hypothetical protein